MRGLRFVTILCCLLVSGLPACSRELTVEQQIIATIRTMEAHVEAGERRPFMDYITEDFSGQDGSMTRDQVRAMMVYQMNRNRRLQAQLFPIQVTGTSDTTATALFSALVTGGRNWLPERGRVFDFETHWILLDGDWRLQSAKWTPTPLEEVL